jgi:hypothetical protein
MKTTIKLLALLTLVACGSKIEHPTCKVFLESNLSPMTVQEMAKSLWLKGYEFDDVLSSGDRFINAQVTKSITKVKDNNYNCKVNLLLRYRDAGKNKYYKLSKDNETKYTIETLPNCEQDFVAAFEPLVPTCEISSQN